MIFTPLPLPPGEGAQGAAGQLRAQRKREPRRPQRVAAEQREVPRASGTDERVVRPLRVSHGQRFEVVGAAVDQPPQWVRSGHLDPRPAGPGGGAWCSISIPMARKRSVPLFASAG
jgi:hypothetical protein